MKYKFTNDKGDSRFEADPVTCMVPSTSWSCGQRWQPCPPRGRPVVQLPMPGVPEVEPSGPGTGAEVPHASVSKAPGIVLVMSPSFHPQSDRNAGLWSFAGVLIPPVACVEWTVSGTALASSGPCARIASQGTVWTVAQVPCPPSDAQYSPVLSMMGSACLCPAEKRRQPCPKDSPHPPLAHPHPPCSGRCGWTSV